MSVNVYLNPVGMTGPQSASDAALPLAGGGLRFSACEVSRRSLESPADVSRGVLAIPELAAVEGAQAWLERLTAPRGVLAGLAMDRPRVMGVVNITPDSFSDGGARFDKNRAIEDGLAMWEAGAEILDLGGESTRPGAEPVPIEEEQRRVLPVVRALAGQGCRVSIDTRNAATMRAAVEAGAAIINDVTALTSDADSLATAADAGVPVILMHMQGTPQTMQKNPRYDDAALDVFDFLADRVAACESAGIARERIVVDPGVGFGKTLQHNLEVMDRLALYQGLGCPVLLGVSRKSMLGRISRGEPAQERLPASLAAALAGAQRGAQILRVHDVPETRQALALWQAVTFARAPGPASGAPATG